MTHPNIIRLQLKAEDALAKAYPMSVRCCKCARVAYQPHAVHQPPHIAYTAGFRKGDYIHIKEVYNDSWWIGRVVGHESQMIFVPRETKLKDITDKISDVDQESMYEDAPIMRPIVFLGPSTCTSKLTQLIQTPLISSMKDKFAGRLLSIHSSVQFGCEEPHPLSIGQLEDQVYQAAGSLDLLHLVCPVSYANDLDSATKLHPLYVYIQVSRAKVLQKLILQTSSASRERELLDCARQLSKNCHGYDLIISESNLEDACERLELFLESYWASTRSILLS